MHFLIFQGYNLPSNPIWKKFFLSSSSSERKIMYRASSLDDFYCTTTRKLWRRMIIKLSIESSNWSLFFCIFSILCLFSEPKKREKERLNSTENNMQKRAWLRTPPYGLWGTLTIGHSGLKMYFLFHETKSRILTWINRCIFNLLREMRAFPAQCATTVSNNDNFMPMLFPWLLGSRTALLQNYPTYQGLTLPREYLQAFFYSLAKYTFVFCSLKMPKEY